MVRYVNKWLALGLLIFFTSCGKLTIVLDEIPENTPQNAQIFLVNSTNVYDYEDNKFRFTQQENGTYALTVNAVFGRVSFLISRGSKTSLEGGLCGNEIPFRNHFIGFKKDTLRLSVNSWRDLNPVNCERITLVVQDFPAGTNPEFITVVGSFNNWNVDKNYRLKFDTDRKLWYVNILKSGGREVEFKMSKGSIQTLETDRFGNEITPRKAFFGESDTLYLSILGWEGLPQSLFKTVVVLEKLPENTNLEDEIYLSGNFNNWFPRDKAFQFRALTANTLYVPLILADTLVEYKITRGSWDSEEVNTLGVILENRILNLLTAPDTVKIEVEEWKDFYLQKNNP
ncbi:MAG: hypothetical protein ACXITV_07325 [Luteibaculaceae bacterium]